MKKPKVTQKYTAAIPSKQVRNLIALEFLGRGGTSEAWLVCQDYKDNREEREVSVIKFPLKVRDPAAAVGAESRQGSKRRAEAGAVQ